MINGMNIDHKSYDDFNIEAKGLVPRFIEEAFDAMSNKNKQQRTHVSASFL